MNRRFEGAPEYLPLSKVSIKLSFLPFNYSIVVYESILSSVKQPALIVKIYTQIRRQKVTDSNVYVNRYMTLELEILTSKGHTMYNTINYYRFSQCVRNLYCR